MKRYHTSFPSWARGFDSPHPLIYFMKKTIFFILIFIFIIKVFPAYSHTVYPLDDFCSISEGAVSFQKKDILPLSAFFGISALLFWQDEAIWKGVKKVDGPEVDSVLRFSKYFGDGLYILAASGFSMIAGETFLSRRFTFLGLYMIEGVIISGIYVTAVKFLTGRSRPGKERGPYSFRPFRLEEANKSFYSGHTTEAFTFASVISHFFKNVYVSSLVYTIAGLTAVERVHSNKHWASDVFVGGFIGILIGRQIIKLNKDYHQLDIKEEGFSISFKLKEF